MLVSCLNMCHMGPYAGKQVLHPNPYSFSSVSLKKSVYFPIFIFFLLKSNEKDEGKCCCLKESLLKVPVIQLFFVLFKIQDKRIWKG